MSKSWAARTPARRTKSHEHAIAAHAHPQRQPAAGRAGDRARPVRPAPRVPAGHRDSQTLHRNYISIEVAQHHARSAAGACSWPSAMALRATRCPARAPPSCTGWISRTSDFTEAGEPELAHDIEGRAQRLFDEIAAAPPQARHDREFDELHARLNDLIAMNQAAMWRADSRAAGLGRRLTYEFAAGLLVAAGDGHRAVVGAGMGPDAAAHGAGRAAARREPAPHPRAARAAAARRARSGGARIQRDGRPSRAIREAQRRAICCTRSARPKRSSKASKTAWC